MRPLGGCQRRGGEDPYAPLPEALAHHLDLCPPASLGATLAGCAWLVRLLPELAAMLEPLPSAAVAPEQERRLIHAAVARLLANVAGTAGTVLILDDLQWAGPDALDVIETLARIPGTARIVVAYRDTEVGPADPLGHLLADLAQARLATQQQLGPLAVADAAVLLEDLLLDMPDGAGVMDEVLRHAGGTPLFLVSYAQALRQGGLTAVPWDVAQGVRQRVALVPVARELLGAAAVIGRRVPRLLLGVVAGQPAEVLLAGLEAACGARLLLEEGEDAYAFAHDVIREVLEAELGAGRRAFLHRRVAEALEAQPRAAPPEVLAYHYGRSGVDEKARAYQERAGDAARARYAHAAAAGYYRSALDHRATDADRARVGLKLDAVLTAAGHYDGAVASLERAVGWYEEAGDREGEARAVALLGEAHFRRGTIQEGLARVQAMLDSLPSSAQPGAAHLYVALARLGPRRELLAAAQQAADLARLEQDDGILATAEALVGYGLLLSQRPREALTLYQRLIPGYRAAGDFANLSLGLTRCAHAHAALGAFGEAQVDLERALAAAERIDDRPLLAEVLELLGWHALITGEWQAAEGYVCRLEEVAGSLGTDHPPLVLLLLRGDLALHRGEWERSADDFEEAESVALRTQDRLWTAVQDKLATHDLATGHPEAALSRMERLGSHLDSDAAWGRLVDYAEAHLRAGHRQLAEEIAAEALAHYRERDDRLRQAELLRVQGMVLAEQDRWEEAEAAFAEVISRAHRLPYPYLEGRTLYELGGMLAHRGDPENARCRLDEALMIFRRLGAGKDIAQVEQVLTTLRQPPTRK